MSTPTRPPLWMPEGSVRSLIALSVTVAFLVSWMSPAITDIPIEVELLVLGFYFGSRTGG